VSTSRGRPTPSRSPLSPDEEDDDYDVIKVEASEAMEDAAQPGADDLLPEYQVVLATGYNEDALLQQVLEASKTDEDRTLPDLQEALPSVEW
jgi:hypothetical protein